jgi:hypothetical protein
MEVVILFFDDIINYCDFSTFYTNNNLSMISDIVKCSKYYDLTIIFMFGLCISTCLFNFCTFSTKKKHKYIIVNQDSKDKLDNI